MLKRKQELFHNVQIIAMFLVLITIIIVLSTVSIFSCFKSLLRVPKDTLLHAISKAYSLLESFPANTHLNTKSLLHFI